MKGRVWGPPRSPWLCSAGPPPALPICWSQNHSVLWPLAVSGATSAESPSRGASTMATQVTQWASQATILCPDFVVQIRCLWPLTAVSGQGAGGRGQRGAFGARRGSSQIAATASLPFMLTFWLPPRRYLPGPSLRHADGCSGGATEMKLSGAGEGHAHASGRLRERTRTHRHTCVNAHASAHLREHMHMP